MLDSHLEHLLADILAIQQFTGFGDQFAVLLAEQDRYDKLVIKVVGETVSRTVVEFSEYPTATVPALWGKSEVSQPVAEKATQLLDEFDGVITLFDVVDAVKEAAKPSGLLVEALSAVNFPDTLRQQILNDYKPYIPNEYAFLLSGTLADGTVTIHNYYAGDMAISTPVYCELKPDFIDRTLYDDMPADHNIVIWGHVHPIESPSGTDTASFIDLAAWDKQIEQIGERQLRSIALLVSSFTKTPSFYDVHTLLELPHKIT